MTAHLTLIPAAIVACTAFVTAAPAQAQAQPDDGARSMVIRYDDLNLRSDAGRTAVRRRIAAAAHEVCDMPGKSADLSIQSLELACIRETIARAQVSFDRQSNLRVASR